MGGADAHYSGAEDELGGACEGDAEWCVDLGGALQAMTTQEIHAALRCGDLRRDARVWGEGLACWMRADEVPELAAVLMGADSGVTPPAVEIAVESAPLLSKAGRDLRVLEPLAGMSGEQALDALLGARTASGSTGAKEAKARPFGRSDWMWVGFGAAFSCLLVGISLLGGPSPSGRGRAHFVTMGKGADLDALATSLRRQAQAHTGESQKPSNQRIEPGQKRRRSAQKAGLR